MPLSPGLDRNVRKSFTDLIDSGHEMLHGLSEETEFMLSYVILGEVTALRMKTQSLARVVLGNTQRGLRVQESIEAVREGFAGIRELVGILEALQHEYVNGFNLGIEEEILANVSRDYLSQAEALLGEGIPGENDHVPAAVLCGAVLENRLRTYCEKHDPPLPTVKSNGDSMTLGALIQELDKAKAFDKQTRKLLKAWADIRNAAAHGGFDDFTREQVELMLLGAKGFIANHL